MSSKLSANTIALLFSIIFISCSNSLATNISYDGCSLIINGEHKIILLGSIHYPRSTPEVCKLTRQSICF